jgi:hypothetical protein
MSDTVHIQYQLTGTGWSEAHVQVGPVEATLTASYLSDALADLIAATCALVNGASVQKVSWTEEPGEFRWLFRSAPDDFTRMTVDVLWFSEIWSGAPDEEGRSVFRATCDKLGFARAMSTAAHNVFDRYGAERYLAEWVEHPFPEDQLHALDLAISDCRRPVQR